MTDDLTISESAYTPFFALDRLNSWLRSNKPLFCPVRSTLKGVIYTAKSDAILDASKRWHIGLNRVSFIAECRSCGGTGTWHSRYDYDYWSGDDEHRSNSFGEACRTCGQNGKVKLKRKREYVEDTL